MTGGLSADTKRLLVVLLLLLSVAPFFYFRDTVHAVTGVTWASPAPVEADPSNNFLTSTLQAQDGTLWIAWQSDRYIGTNIFYKTFKNNVWSIPVSITNTGYDMAPSLAQLKNGTILFFWSNQTGTHTVRLVYQRYNSGYWAYPSVLTNPAGEDASAATAVGPDGKLWVIWTRVIYSCPTCMPTRQLFYRTMMNNIWSAEVPLTNDSNWNWMPSIAIGKDGVVRVAWSKGQPLTAIYQVWYKTFDGLAWTPERQIVISSYSDTRSSIMVDRDGSIWLFWSRQVPVGILDSFHIYSKYSTDSGATWTADTQMTFDPVGKTVTDQMPAAVQTSVGNSIWLFYTTNAAPGTNEFDIYVLKSSRIAPVHDVAITNIQASPSLTYPWGAAPSQSLITFTVTNLGDFSENVPVAIQASINSTIFNVGTYSVNVLPTFSSSITVLWNITKARAPAGHYAFTASTPRLAGESAINAADNTLTVQNAQIVLLPGALAKTLCVTIIDASMMARAFGSTPGTFYWNPDADLANQGVVTIISFGILASHFNQCL
ncbi:MAG TPA: sialidase family protein [Candidatus Bathyarchaeia archaeon]|nr:sialidase family protein [Candidatus Bathyarchaeia archaeon]